MVGHTEQYVCLASKQGSGHRSESRPDSEYESEHHSSAPYFRAMESDSIVGLRYLYCADQIAWHSILANGAVIFVYKLRENLDIGIGAGLTNSFGVPMVLPMGYLNWRTSGKYEIRVNMSSGLKVAVSKRLNRRLKLELTAIEMDGISSVMRIDGKSRIYSSTMMRSTLSQSFSVSPKVNVYCGIGANWLRSIRTSERSFGGFLESFREEGHDFDTSFRVTAGFDWSF